MIRILLALLSAVLLVLSFPNFDLGFVAWIALVPLLLALRNTSIRSTLILSWISGASFFMGVFSWINSVKGVTLLHYSILGLYLGLYFPLFGLFFYFISRKTKLRLVITAPPLWVAIEYLRSNAGFAALPMGFLGHTQHQNVSLIQIASFTGAYGISFLIILANAVIADLIVSWIEKKEQEEPLGLARSPVFRGSVVLAMILIVWILGYTSLPSPLSGRPLSMAVVQGNIPQEIKWKREYREQILTKYENLSEEASKSKPQLIIWPEASTPGFVLSDQGLLERMVSTIRRMDAYLLAGSSEYPKFGKKQIKLKSGNTALFFSPEGKILGQYLKIYLVPFGEYVPYEGIIHWPEFIVPKGMNSDVAGTERVLFEIERTKFGTLICSEILYPELSRCMVKQGAGFLVNISNEAWFGKGALPYQALSIAVFRAVENRVNLVRCANTGVSGFIDPHGRVTARLTNGGEDLFVEGTLTRKIFLSSPGTFYTHYGDVFAYGCIAFSIGLLIYSISGKVFLQRSSHDPASY